MLVRPPRNCLSNILINLLLNYNTLNYYLFIMMIDQELIIYISLFVIFWLIPVLSGVYDIGSFSHAYS
jgi:hypothetical protein